MSKFFDFKANLTVIGVMFCTVLADVLIGLCVYGSYEHTVLFRRIVPSIQFVFGLQ